MKAIEVIRLDKKIRATSFSAEALREAAQALASITSAVDARTVCRAMSETWQRDVLPFARELLSSKKAAERERGLELFAYVPDLSLIPEVEAAKAKDRSKKLHRTYDFAVRRMRKAHERDNPAADPLDTTANPIDRMNTLAKLPHQDLWELADLRDRYWHDIELPTLGVDASGRRELTADGQTWSLRIHPATVEVLPGQAELTTAARAAKEKLETMLAQAVAKRHRRARSLLRSGQTQPYWLAQLLYIAHPLAGRNATQLVWEASVDGDWVAYRGTAEGTPADTSGDAVTFSSTAPVRLAHPVELDATQLEAWLALAHEEGWSDPLEQLATPTFADRDVSLQEAVRTTPPLDERRAKAWLVGEGLEPVWVHEHREPHATEHALSNDRGECWLRVHHDPIVARRTGSEPLHVTELAVPRSTKRRHSEAVRLLRDLAQHAAVSSERIGS